MSDQWANTATTLQANTVEEALEAAGVPRDPLDEINP
ncbi:MAG: DUF348 domain-containing protein, partial [Anaerolineae bacterium]|nr:DUF348 domain-containing protein [Anaerolineae bacterium]